MRSLHLIWMAFVITNRIYRGQALFSNVAHAETQLTTSTQGLGERVCQIGQEADPNNQGKLRWMNDAVCLVTGSNCDKIVLGGVDVNTDRQLVGIPDCYTAIDDSATLLVTNSVKSTTTPISVTENITPTQTEPLNHRETSPATMTTVSKTKTDEIQTSTVETSKIFTTTNTGATANFADGTILVNQTTNLGNPTMILSTTLDSSASSQINGEATPTGTTAAADHITLTTTSSATSSPNNNGAISVKNDITLTAPGVTLVSRGIRSTTSSQKNNGATTVTTDVIPLTASVPSVVSLAKGVTSAPSGTTNGAASASTATSHAKSTSNDITLTAPVVTVVSSGIGSATSSQKNNGATAVTTDIPLTASVQSVVSLTKDITSAPSGTTNGAASASTATSHAKSTSNDVSTFDSNASLTPSGAISSSTSATTCGIKTSRAIEVTSVTNGTTSGTSGPLHTSSGKSATTDHMSSTPSHALASTTNNKASTGTATPHNPTFSEESVTTPPLSVSIPVFRDCTEARDNGYTSTRLYSLSLLGIVTPFWCDMDTDGGGWMVFQRRQDGSVDFHQKWADYADGFGTPDGECWLGNSALKQMTSDYNFELRIDLYDWEGNQAYAYYGEFNIMPGNKYTLKIAGYEGTAGDSLSYTDGSSFSTIDNDNDNSANNCMEIYGGGWWTNNCFNSNLNSYYHQSSELPDSKGIVWAAWKGTTYALRKTEMKMRMKSTN